MSRKHSFIRARRIIGARGFHRVARIAQVHEIDAFDNTAIGHVQTGNDTGFQHGPVIARTCAARKRDLTRIKDSFAQRRHHGAAYGGHHMRDFTNRTAQLETRRAELIARMRMLDAELDSHGDPDWEEKRHRT